MNCVKRRRGEAVGHGGEAAVGFIRSQRRRGAETLRTTSAPLRLCERLNVSSAYGVIEPPSVSLHLRVNQHRSAL
ncbi:hypothetical protein ERY430_50015 [Erythrobacter sp. EC-HK427]|nr:hypothetical protein ERY430_50015 [Erythrobacter sp. EC-HK427]